MEWLENLSNHSDYVHLVSCQYVLRTFNRVLLLSFKSALIFQIFFTVYVVKSTFSSLFSLLLWFFQKRQKKLSFFPTPPPQLRPSTSLRDSHLVNSEKKSLVGFFQSVTLAGHTGRLNKDGRTRGRPDSSFKHAKWPSVHSALAHVWGAQPSRVAPLSLSLSLSLSLALQLLLN